MYSAKVTLKYDSVWEHKGGIYDEEILPEEHYTFEVPSEDLNTIQLFQLFEKFCYAMGHNSDGIAKGAVYVAFNEMRTVEAMRKTAEEYDLILAEDYRNKLVEYDAQQDRDIKKLEAEVRDLKAKLSRLENPDNPNYMDEEIEAMTEEVIAEASKPTLKTLENAEVTCHDCGKKYGEYSVGCSSTWAGKCDICGQLRGVTEVRDYGYFAKTIKEMNSK